MPTPHRRTRAPTSANGPRSPLTDAKRRKESVFMTQYQVSLDRYHGPLHLLLYLVKRNEVDVRDIPVARLAEQFIEHLAVIELLDVDLAGDFLVMAATLMEIKSKLLLPHDTEALVDEPDPRQELVRQLIEYRKFK